VNVLANIALIIAGGSGSRMNQDIPKQFLLIYDKPIIVYTMEAFQSNPSIDSILAVCIEGWQEAMSAYAKQYNISKLRLVICGGETRHSSVKKGIDALVKTCLNLSSEDIIMIHDANRPLVPQETIDDCIKKAQKYGACVPVLPVNDWMLWSDDGMVSSKSMEKNRLMRAQSPEAATYANLVRIYEQAKKLNSEHLSGLSSIMTELGEQIHFSKGSERLMKITTVEDLELVKALIDS